MIELRPITDAEVPQFSSAITAGFGRDEPEDATSMHDGFRANCDLRTTLAAFADDRIVATFASFDLELAVPGGSLPMAGTTAVTVAPTHRRRGLLTEMMTRHLNQAVERGQPVAGLWASEEVIYGRFGYGQAVESVTVEVPTKLVSTAPPPSDVTIGALSDEEARRQLPPIHDRSVRRGAGGFPRTAAWWNWEHFVDPPHRRNGATSRRTVLAKRNGEPVGYAVYRQRAGSGPDGVGRVEIVEIVHDDDDARRALWHFLTNIDLYRIVYWWLAPVDEPMLIETERFRSLTVSPIDTLWLRMLDVPTSLAARTYEGDGSLVLDVVDSLLDRGGLFRFEVIDGVGHCERLDTTHAEADATLDVGDLSALYLGGRSARTYARAGRIVGDVGAIQALDRIFHTSAAPYCGEVF
ncbi:MAG: GNAT family N-acetyltransferase [Acidimicrobiales bacterium]